VRGEQAVADADDSFDVAGVIRVVPELPAQAAEVARERVVSELGFISAQGIRDLAVRDHDADPRGERIEKDVLARRKSYLVGSLTDALVESVNLKIGNP
jgi:hypothetical protein